ncbi:C-type mannose receptor 2-like [Sardina pilchardus]|uniref:C-type mannose receptor 2-like n=1 Tax=Sardina pilchardus TaxID=27697 RepID=UPI002E16430F
MEWRLALLLFSGFVMECIPHHFHFVDMSKTWTEAQRYCREHYTDLATIENMEDMQMMMDTAKDYEGTAWIGLHQTAVSSWKWSSDKFQLVKKNLTWTEALMYCRQHHMDLVSVTSPEIQGWVIEEAKRASTDQVWLGLRYLCPLNIWFWVSGETVCWENWAEEREKENRREGCGGHQRAGALQSGGEWVSLPDSTRLNFICAAGEMININCPLSKRRQFVRVELQVNSSSLEVNTPEVQEVLLRQIKVKLQKNGLPEGAKLSWIKHPDGQIFHEKNENGEKKEGRSKDEF